MNGIAYDFRALPFMRQQGPVSHVTEAYVSIPSALVITDSEGALWTLGFDQGGARCGEFEFDVVRADPSDKIPHKTGEFACRIEYRGGKIRIFGSAGWRTWSGKTFI